MGLGLLGRVFWIYLSFLVMLDCFQYAFPLKIHPVLISSSAIANHDVIAPAGISPRGEIPRRHSSNSRVY